MPPVQLWDHWDHMVVALLAEWSIWGRNTGGIERGAEPRATQVGARVMFKG